MSKYFLYSHLEKTFHSIRKEAREKFYISFHRAYILVMVLNLILIVLHVLILNVSANSGYQMTRIEIVRREKQQEKHLLRAQIAQQESREEINQFDDRLSKINPQLISFASLD